MKKIVAFILLNLSFFLLANEPTLSKSEAQILAKAETLAKDKSSREAVNYIKKNLDTESSAAVNYAIAIYCLDYDDTTTARKQLQNALKKMPNFHRAQLQLAKLEYEAENWEVAAQLFSKLIDGNYKNPTLIWKFLARSRFEQKQFIAAETAFRQVLIRDVNDEPSQRALIICLIEQNRLQEAKPLIRKMLSKRPKDVELWLLATAIAIESGNREEALVKLATAERMGVEDVGVKQNLASLYFENELYDLAAKTFLELNSKKKLSDNNRVQAIQAFISIERIDVAKILLAGTKLETEPILLAKARIAEMGNEPVENVKNSYQSLLKKFPLSYRGLINFAEFLQNHNDLNNAEFYLKRAIRTSENNRRAMLVLAQLHVSQEKYHDAIALLQKVLFQHEDKSIRNYLNQVRKIAQ